ncbi:enoyl-CoA hydratase/isomerase family protein [Paraburkholderia gardini]|uniref:Short-chain-enoyl-CoA hydratase n=1 Tax=Paraburkholderia gardini TaxID=2823469 RepID=A0ABM8U9C4_9BURK|nr:enoyl-CoA hydratase-related protein [Paraburkholderia gardini]CAG4918950.1 Short-chain-enoyl-CoA hydratase [Paraburkholderia gardini]
MNCPDDLIHSNSPLLSWRDGAIAHLRFNRPAALNAIDLATAQAFRSACEVLAEDREVRAVVISGAGRAFIAGGDVASLREDPVANAQKGIALVHAGVSILAALEAPVIASVHGAVAGGGLGIMLGCDLTIAAEGTRFSLAYPNLGASCDCSTSWVLPRVVGLRKALEIALLDGMFDADEALRLGVVNRVVPADRLEQEAGALAARLASGPTRALGQLKRLMCDSFERSFDEQLAAEAEAFVQCASTADFREGVGAFVEKRTPCFRGE